MKISRDSLMRSLRDYIFITIGIFIYAFGFSAFIFQEKVVIGGLAGLGTIVYFISEKWLGFPIPVAITQYACNLTLLAFAYKMVGKQFVKGTIF